jgi:tRNA pseudouridine38-40 synthase
VRTVQGELESAAKALFGAPTRVALAGRTDAGVHARGQVAAFTAETRLEAATIERALNALLPADVAVRLVRFAGDGFDPRRWARRRTYRYTLIEVASRDPLSHRFAWHIAQALDLPAMNQATAALVGRQDFIACSGPLEAGRTSVRTVFNADWDRSGDFVAFDIMADAFLPNMVRRIVGALVHVGRGTLKGEDFVRLLKQASPATVGPLAPPQGLCLERVEYDEGYAP